MAITTGDIARALTSHYPCTTEEVAAWCEEGLLKARRNPSKRLVRPKWRVLPDGIPDFLETSLEFSENEIREVLKKLKINFRRQLSIVA